MAPDPCRSNPELKKKRDELYERCLEATAAGEGDNSDIFNQSDLTALGVTSDQSELMILCQSLINEYLFQLLTLENQICWRCRPRDAANRMSSMNEKDYMVYTTIEASSTAGIWTKSIAAKTNLHQSVLTKSLKWLETKGHVKQIKSVKFPKRKIYMLKDLEPAEEVSGGPWFSDGELDVEFIELIAKLVEGHIKEQSWRKGPKLVTKKKAIEGGSEEVLEIDYTNDPRFYHPAASDHDKRGLLPYPATYPGFPSASEVLNWIDAEGFINQKDIQLQDINALLDVLVFDGRIERMGQRPIDATFTTAAAPKKDEEEDEDDEDAPRKKPKKSKASTASSSAMPEIQMEDMFRWVLRPEGEDIENGPGNGWSEAPCSRCPVFRLCEEGGPVDAKSCEYFGKWLDPEAFES